ncbi:hypothetical protein GCM10010168_16770 [Actinoplanes ianthinogenes]|uniref:Uncharacterized protein n=1 Tax=Actinoplanes ianthinogenes TaxID=122358 RepID=A0ABM7LZU7_9ACTN|nr:hypothetical protein Aiant_55210 [Actinoplanes ianthinogenes]GGR00437.1 hypothetical protein GCM10010168_16770 [Actinoplanes ianthinogenes]
MLLTIIGMIGGYLLSERKDRGTEATSPTTDAAPSYTPSAPPSLLPTDGLCPQQTQDFAVHSQIPGPLSQVVRRRTTAGTVIWICQNEAGQLFYHANKGGESATWIEGKTALFLRDVVHEPDGSYEGTASDGSIFNLNDDRLLITPLSGKPRVQDLAPE